MFPSPARAVSFGESPRKDIEPLPSHIEGVLRGFAPEAHMTARGIFQLYGMPDEVTPYRVSWFDKGPFVETTITKDAHLHNFPVPHHDTIEQCVKYPVGNALGKFDDLGAFDGSLHLRRTQGFLCARHDSPALNTLSLNLAHDIITGRRSWQQARAFFVQAAKALRNGNRVPYAQQLQFRANGDTTDADVSG